MSKHMVICQKCGRQFDASRGGYYDAASRRYTCKSCGKAHNRTLKEAEADKREARTGMRQTQGAMIAKIVVGVICIISAFATETAGAALVGIIVGLGVIAWGLLPWWKVKKAEKAAAAAAAAEAQAKIDAQKVCPFCGAPTKGEVCEYCGSPLPKS